MSYSEPLINQPKVLLLSIGVGVLLCVIYVFTQGFFRLFGNGRFSYYFADSVFCVIFTLVSFFFMVLYNNGRVRLHLILGEISGFYVMYFSLGKYVYSMLFKLSCFIVKAVKLFGRPYVKVFNSFVFGMRATVKDAADKIKTAGHKENKEKNKKFKKINLFNKIHLKNSD